MYVVTEPEMAECKHFFGGKKMVATSNFSCIFFFLLQLQFNSTKRKFLDWSKLKALADDKINVTQKQIFLSGWVENIAGKEEKAG